MPNTEQIEHWDGEGGEHWVALAEEYDRLNQGFTEHIVGRLAPQPGERILDVGCGNGALSLAVARRAGAVVGLDISGPMLANAARRAAAAGLDNVTFEKGDAQVHSLPQAPFDGAVSRFGVMFFEDPAAAFANVARMLRPGGRLVFTCWQELLANEWLVVPSAAALAYVPMPELGEAGAPGPFSLADADRVESLLRGAGFAEVDITAVTAPMCFGTTVDDAVGFMQQTEMAAVLMQDQPDDVVAKAWGAVRETVAPYETPDGVFLTGTAWLVAAATPST